jgi:hypothetical protein
MIVGRSPMIAIGRVTETGAQPATDENRTA